MEKCRNHPDRETNYICTKHNVYLCEECLHCTDPDIYCKFRTACPIWFMDKKKAGLDEEKKVEEVGKKYKVIFKPDNKTIDLSEGTFLNAGRIADVHINASYNSK